MKSLLLLWNKLAKELAGMCCTSATMDIKTVHRRCEHEGLSFLTITLPDFGKDFERCLDLGHVDRRSFALWKVKSPKGKREVTPVFLRGFLDRVFDRHSGVLLDEPCIDSIIAIRQLTLMFSKIALPCSNTRIRKAMQGYIECEKEVVDFDNKRSTIELDAFRRMSNMLFATSLSEADHKIYNLEMYPKHGPGATADKLTGNRKWNQHAWPIRMEEAGLPAGEFLLPNWRFYDQYSDIDFLEPGAEMPVKVITVPKTLKTPRIIGIEPTVMQYMQQSILPILLDALQPSNGLHARDDFLAHVIGFNDQSPNQRLALEGSLKQELATLDLSEASDRVSCRLVEEMLRDWPHLSKAVFATRSTKADVPGHGVQTLSKFASMGSALCFPIEAMVFTTLIFLGIEKALNTPFTRKSLKRFKGKVRVYGDDIIVPVEYVQTVVDSLESYGFKVNSRKSFWTGKFRESCGKEYYDGQDVSIVKVRAMFPAHRSDATGVISLIAFRNQLYFAGYWATVQWLDDEIRRVIKHFPVVLPSSPVQGRHSFLGYESKKMCDELHRPLVRGYVVHARIPENPLDGSGALLKYHLKRGGQPSVNDDHLERSGRPQAVNIKLRWTSAV
jgi:hypothetical protein